MRAPWLALVSVAALTGCEHDFVTTSASGAGGATSSSATASNAAPTGSTSASGAGGCSGDPGNQGAAIANPDDPCATLDMPAEPSERIVFLEKGMDSTFSNPIELMWAWRYAARVPTGMEASYTLEEERCSKPAGEAETCDVVPLAPLATACAGPVFGPKFAVDPTQYNAGENVYRITLRLREGCVVKSSDSFTMKLTYTP